MSQPFMQLWVGDYLGDTRHLSTEQHGAYLLLLMSMWRLGGSVPADDEKLSRLAGLTLTRWNRVKGDVMALLLIEQGEVTQKRLRAELKKAEEKSSKRSEAGKRGVEAKSMKNKEQAQAIAPAMLKHSSEPEPYRKKKDNALARFDEFWLSCPKKTGRGPAEKAWPKALLLADADTLIAAMRAYAGTCTGKEKTYIKTPGPWLNEKRWLDEGIAPAENPMSPEQIEAAKDRADQLLRRGKYDPQFSQRGAA